jgi:hypothetical protein
MGAPVRSAPALLSIIRLASVTGRGDFRRREGWRGRAYAVGERGHLGHGRLFEILNPNHLTVTDKIWNINIGKIMDRMFDCIERTFLIPQKSGIHFRAELRALHDM